MTDAQPAVEALITKHRMAVFGTPEDKNRMRSEVRALDERLLLAEACVEALRLNIGDLLAFNPTGKAVLAAYDAHRAQEG